MVTISPAAYESLRETASLLRGPANARRLPASIERLENSAGTPRERADDEIRLAARRYRYEG